MNDEKLRIKEANRIFYDIAADIYEQVDGRRTTDFPSWLDNNLKKIAEYSDKGSLLDIGTGTGWIACRAKEYFDYVVAIDISSAILKKIERENIIKVSCDAEFMPFRDESFDVAVSFSLLHHIYDIESLLKEIYRILRAGGILYTDHDIEKNFVRRFSLPMRIYRKIFDASRRYNRADKRLTRELYQASEIHSDGIDGKSIEAILNSIGFSETVISYHWLGLSSVTDKFLGNRLNKRGWAPILSIIAKKSG